MSRRAGAILALLGGVAALALAAEPIVLDFPRGLVVLAGLLAALWAAWFGLLHRGLRRALWLALAVVLLAAGVAAVASGGNVLTLASLGIAFAVAVLGARAAFRPARRLPSAAPPSHPVLFVNPRSGDGTAARVGLVEAARSRGLEIVVLEPGDDLERLVRAAVERGADALAMAGGDGSQAVVAAIAAEHDLPYACIPAGTRNHFALDLGVDRDDVIGALDAFRSGGERYVDLGEVNGRVFVNNVSLGVYAEAVSQDRYRAAKLRTLLDTMSEALGPEGEACELRWTDEDGYPCRSTALILISNNPYRLGPTLGSGTRPRLDTGLLGIVDFHPPTPDGDERAPRWRELRAPELEIEADEPIPLGIDGESVTLEPPLRFRIRPRALRVRIAHDHPGASPSSEIPHGPLGGLRQLLWIAAGKRPSARETIGQWQRR
ncbi:MAG TPA: diacylglycerol kinase family protein [Solirubrobacterales bacterium]